MILGVLCLKRLLLTFIVTVFENIYSTALEKRLYITSLAPDAQYLGYIIRKHWYIESMHWNLDRNFLKDSIKRRHTKAAFLRIDIRRFTGAVRKNPIDPAAYAQK